MSKTRRIILPLAGGLGNQLFQFAHAMARSCGSEILILSGVFALRSNKEGDPELLDFNLPQNVSVQTSSKNFQRSLTKLSSLILRIGVSNFPTLLKKSLLSILYPVATLIFRLNTGIWAQVFAGTNIGFSNAGNQNTSVVYIGYFQSYRWLEGTSLENLTLSPLGLRDVSPLCELIINSSQEKRILGIHVRLGDYRQEPKIGLLPKQYYEDALKLLELHKYDEIWVFTNDKQGAELILPDFKDSNIFWIPMELSSAETLTLMTYCTDFIISNSTFSWWGAYLNRNENCVVICPEVWFEKAEDPVELCPPGWLRIGSFS